MLVTLKLIFILTIDASCEMFLSATLGGAFVSQLFIGCCCSFSISSLDLYFLVLLCFCHTVKYFNECCILLVNHVFLHSTLTLSGCSFAMADSAENDKNIEIWKVKKLIKALESARGNGISMISLIIPPGDQISRVNKMLAEEYGTTSNIKSRVNRQSMLAAITSAQQKLKLYNKVPPNALVLYTGTVVTEDGKEKKVAFAFEPFKPFGS